MSLYLTLSKSAEVDEAKQADLQEKLLKTFSYVAITGNDIHRYEHSLIAHLYKHPAGDGNGYQEKHWYKDTSIWRVLSLERQETEWVHHYEQWCDDFTVFCNDLMAQGVVSHWRWENHPRATWDNKADERDKFIDSCELEKGIQTSNTAFGYAVSSLQPSLDSRF
jgi:hypothetical protein